MALQSQREKFNAVENEEFSELVWRDGQVQSISLPRKISSSQVSSFSNMKRRFESLNMLQQQQQHHLNMFMEVPNNPTDSQIVPVNEYANLQGDSTKGNDATVPTNKSMDPVASSSFCSNNLKRRCSGDSETSADQNVEEEEDVRKQVCGSKRKRIAELHNQSERKRRDKINQKMRALRELIPNCNKIDKASMLDEAIQYLKCLQLQVQIMSMGSGGYCMPQPQMMGIMHQQIQAAQMAAMSMRLQQMGPLMISPMVAAMAGFQPPQMPMPMPMPMPMFCTPPLGLLDQTVPVHAASMLGSQAKAPPCSN